MFSKLLRRSANKPLSSPLTHLLTSNNPPSDVEETLARNTIQALQDSLTVLQLEITATNDLQGHKATIIKSISAHESIISPLRRLPPELLQVIFQKTCWESETTFTLPWSLSQVCRSWRLIVHATPILWSCITITFYRDWVWQTEPTRLRRQEARLKFILQRSFNVDLRVSIHRGMQSQSKYDKRLSLLLILMAHSERWGYLDLDLRYGSSGSFFFFLQAVKEHLPRLSQLRLKLQLYEPKTIDMFSVAPRLETVVIENDHHLKLNVFLPLQQLSSYDQVFRGELITSLATFSHLVRLGIVWEPTIGSSKRCTITFPRLEILVIYFSYKNRDSNSADKFFEQLILPCIRDIDVEGGVGGVTFPISSMISRSLPCKLRTLRLSITTTAFEDPLHLASLLLLTPQLKNLRIPLSLLLGIFATSIPPLPELQSLCIVVPKNSSPSSFSPRATSIAKRVERLSYTEFRLQLSFEDERECRTAYFAMQPPPEVGELDGDVLALINSWKKRLVDDIPFLSSYRTSRKKFINKLMHWRRLDQLFNAIEGYDIPTSGYLHVSKLHFVMHSITSPSSLYWNGMSSSARVPGNERYHFCSRAKALLARWEPILLQDVHYYQWLNNGDPNALTYIPKQADFRKSSNAIDLIYSRARMHLFYK